VTEATVTTDPTGEHIDDGQDEQESSQKRERSTIRFPYVDLAGAEQIARAVHDNYGLGSCEQDQLAANLQRPRLVAHSVRSLPGPGRSAWSGSGGSVLS